MELHSYDIVLFEKLELKYIQFIEITVTTWHVIEKHILGLVYSLSICVCSIHP